MINFKIVESIVVLYCIGTGAFYPMINANGWIGIHMKAHESMLKRKLIMISLFIFGLPISYFNMYDLGYKDHSWADFFKGFIYSLLLLIYIQGSIFLILLMCFYFRLNS